MTWFLEDMRSQEELANRFLTSINGGETNIIVGAHDGMSSLLAKEVGFKYLYLSGGALSASLGLPDIGILTLDDVVTKARELIRASNMPLLVDIDNGFGEPLNVARACYELVEARVAAVQIEDQEIPKKCGHLNGKKLISKEDMVKKIKTIKQVTPSLVIVARSDAHAIESFDAMINRLNAYVEAGADIVFPEAMQTIEDFENVKNKVSAPVLANMTEFGKTEYINVKEFQLAGVDYVLYPVTSLRAAAFNTKSVYQHLKTHGTQVDYLNKLQTRKELYDVLKLHDFESMDESIDKTELPKHIFYDD